MNRLKKWIAVLMAVCMCIGMMAGCGNAESTAQTEGAKETTATEVGTTAAENEARTEAEEEDDVAHIVVAYPTNGTIPKDLELVQDAINEITVEEINTEVELITVEIGNYSQQMNLKLTSGEQLDCMLTFPAGAANFANMTSQGFYIPLNELLESYGQDLYNRVGADILKATTFKGEIYGVPAYYDVCESVMWYMRKDLLEKYDLVEQAEATNSFEDMEAILQVIADNEPSVAGISNAYIGGQIITTSDQYFLNGFDNGTWFDRLGENTLQLAVVDQQQDPTKIVNAYETETYMETVKVIRDWYEKGLVYKDSSITQEPGTSLIKSGVVFSFFSMGNPTELAAKETACGYELVQVEVHTGVLSSTSFKNFVWGITVNSEETEAAMKFLNMLYTDERIVNLLNYGIEGVHYIDNGDGTIRFADGLSRDTTGYFTFTYWFFGNAFIRKMWEGSNPSVLAEREAVLQAAKKSERMDFAFDNSAYGNEVTAISNVINQYRPGIESGSVDPEVEVPKFLEALKAAGADVYLQAYQEQLDEYYANK